MKVDIYLFIHSFTFQVQQSSELAFVDSSSNMEELNLRIFLFCTHSVVGALPLGILIVSDETTNTLVQGFTKLKESMGENAFYQRKDLGPLVIMTDNCSELRDALQIVWPNTRLLLCIFHILQQIWRWLHDRNNGVSSDDRPILLQLMKSVLYSRNEDAMEDLIDDLRSNQLVKTYPKAGRYFESVLDIKESWALAHRSNLMLRENNTNNYVESQFLVIKDEILNRVKEYNVVGLLDKLSIDLDYHYKTKMLSLADGSFDGIYRNRFKGLLKNLPSKEDLDIVQAGVVSLGNDVFEVPSFSVQNKVYLVDMNISLCQCTKGENGAPCKHQYVLWSRKFSCASNSFLPVFSALDRKRYAEIAVGGSAPLFYYEGLRDRILAIDEVEKSDENMEVLENDPISQTDRLENTTDDDSDSSTSLFNDSERALDKAFQYLKSKLKENDPDPSLLSGAMKFSKHLLKLPTSRLGSALHCFGSTYAGNSSIKSLTGKRTKRKKISVQPEAIKSRKIVNGSRQKQSKGNSRSSGMSIPNKS